MGCFNFPQSMFWQGHVWLVTIHVRDLRMVSAHVDDKLQPCGKQIQARQGECTNGYSTCRVGCVQLHKSAHQVRYPVCFLPAMLAFLHDHPLVHRVAPRLPKHLLLWRNAPSDFQIFCFCHFLRLSLIIPPFGSFPIPSNLKKNNNNIYTNFGGQVDTFRFDFIVPSTPSICHSIFAIQVFYISSGPLQKKPSFGCVFILQCTLKIPIAKKPHDLASICTPNQVNLKFSHK